VKAFSIPRQKRLRKRIQAVKLTDMYWRYGATSSYPVRDILGVFSGRSSGPARYETLGTA
jgi:hypothetical protein